MGGVSRDVARGIVVMGIVRSFFRILLGYVLAVLAAGVVQVLFAMPPAALLELSGDALAGRLSVLGIYSLAAATHTAIFALVFALVAIALAEWQAVRSATYYLMAGLAIALAGFLAQYASENATQPTIVNTYAMLAYAVAGLSAGLVYWAFAGSRAGGRSAPHAPDGGSDDGAGDDTGPPRPGSKYDMLRTAPAGTSVPTTHPAGRPKPLQVA